MNLLHIDSSILGADSASRQIGAAIVARLKAKTSDLAVTYRDLAARPLPHLSHSSLNGTGEADIADAVMEEFLAADVLVVGVPMYNFNIPTQLKAWIDRIVVAGKTFRYTPEGPLGLASGKKLIVAGAYGGFHAADAASNFIEPYLRYIFGFIGVTDIEFVTAEGLSVSAEQRARSMQNTLARIAGEVPQADVSPA